MELRRFCACFLLMCSSVVGSGVRSGLRAGINHPQLMDDILGDNYHVEYDLETDRLELTKGTHPEKAARVAEQRCKRSEEEDEKTQRVTDDKAKVAKEEASKKFWAEKRDAALARSVGAGEEGKKAKFKLAEKKKARAEARAGRAEGIKGLKGSLAQIEDRLKDARAVLKEKSEAWTDATQAFESSTNANEKAVLKRKVGRTLDEMNKAKSARDFFEEAYETKQKAVTAQEKKDKEVDEEDGKKDADAVAEEKESEKKEAAEKEADAKIATKAAEAEEADPQQLNGKLVLLLSNSPGPTKGKFFSSCPGQGGTNEWLDGDKPDLTRGWKIVVDGNGKIESGKTTVHFMRWCGRKANTKPLFLLSNMREDAGLSWGDKKEALAWTLEFGDVPPGTALDIRAGSADTVRNKPTWKFAHVRNVFIKGNGVAAGGGSLAPYLHSNRPEKQGASWGKKDGQANWRMYVLKDAVAKPEELSGALKAEPEEDVTPKTVKHGGECTLDEQCEGVRHPRTGALTQGLCRKCGKCQSSFQHYNPCGDTKCKGKE